MLEQAGWIRWGVCHQRRHSRRSTRGQSFLKRPYMHTTCGAGTAIAHGCLLPLNTFVLYCTVPTILHIMILCVATTRRALTPLPSFLTRFVSYRKNNSEPKPIARPTNVYLRDGALNGLGEAIASFLPSVDDPAESYRTGGLNFFILSAPSRLFLSVACEISSSRPSSCASLPSPLWPYPPSLCRIGDSPCTYGRPLLTHHSGIIPHFGLPIYFKLKRWGNGST